MRFLLSILFAILMIPFSISNAQISNFSIPGSNGQLVGILQTPDNLSEFPLVIISHGFTSEKNFELLTTLSDELESRGIATIRFDFDGHGESGGDFQAMTVPKEIEDLKTIYKYATSIEGVTSISLAGHSQGGVVTSMVAGDLGKKKIRSIALLAPAAILREDAIRGMAFGETCDPLDPPEYVEIVRPHGSFKIGRDYILTSQTLPIFETAEKYRGDVCIIHGTGDRIVPYTMSMHYNHVFKNSELHLIPREDHSFRGDMQGAAKIAADFFEKKLSKVRN
ncbi:MAG: alpha/beta fold hydrolase [Selenomonadaceae bacterium]|nr:alpha/beta fold hydrolase [Selenomonadaceae bacterium]